MLVGRCHVVRAVLVILVVATGCEIMRAPDAAERPRWHFDADAHYESSCVDAHAFVRKSGREGFGVAIQLVNHRDCHVRISGSWHVAGRVTTVAPIDLDMHGHSLRYGWLPVYFDNNQVWNDGNDDGELVLVVDSGETQAPLWTIHMHQQWGTP